MRRIVTAVAAAVLLAGPAALAFFSGGYFAQPRLIAALVVWACLLGLALSGPVQPPATTAGRLALGGLAAMFAWSALSLLWAPLAGPALVSIQRLSLYLGALLLAVQVLRDPRLRFAVEPALLGGIALAIGYGLLGRVLPGLIEMARSVSAGGRLEQPITYWNSEGLLAAVGVVLAARVAGDVRRRPLLRGAAAAAAPALGAAVYISFSRGALTSVALGLIVLVAFAPQRAQLRAAALVLAGGLVAGAVAAVLPGVASLAGSMGARERDGLIALAAFVLAGALTAWAVLRRPARDDATVPAWAPRLRPAAAVVAALIAIGLVIGGLGERPSAAELARGADAGRLTTVSSNRYDYWRVGLGAFAREPITGLGAGGFRVEWLRERDIAESVKDVHSLELEMLAELGLPGLLAFAALLAGVVLAARDVLRADAAAAAGPAAALAAWLLHASIDWDWQFPAAALPAIVLAGALLAARETAPRAPTTARADRAPAPAPSPGANAPDPARS
jgi:hypothetical protein